MKNGQKPKYQILSDLKALRIRKARLEAMLADYEQDGKQSPESEADYKLLVESLKDVVVRLSPAGELIYVSPAIKKFGGYDPESEIGKPM